MHYRFLDTWISELNDAISEWNTYLEYSKSEWTTWRISQIDWDAGDDKEKVDSRVTDSQFNTTIITWYKWRSWGYVTDKVYNNNFGNVRPVSS